MNWWAVLAGLVAGLLWLLVGLVLAELVGVLLRWWRRQQVRQRRRSVLSAGPQPPVNVRIEFGDGRLVPVECVYAGCQPGPDGGPIFHWVAVTELAAATLDGAVLAYDHLPARTSVALAVRHDPSLGP